MKRSFTSFIVLLLILTALQFSSVTPVVVSAKEIVKEHRLTLLLNTRQIYQKNSMYLAPSPHVVNKGVTYISMRALAERLGYKVSYHAPTKQSVMANAENTLAVSRNAGSYDFNGKSLAFNNGAQPYVIQGTLMVPLRDLVTLLDIKVTPKLSENKVELTWKTIEEQQQIYLQAKITTNKNTYKIGEPIKYEDLSEAIGSPITKVTWINNKDAFFESGPQTVKLLVENASGQQSQTTKSILITDEVMYTETEYNQWFTPIGEKLAINRDAVLSFKEVPYQIKEEPFTLVRSNSPEQIVDEGIYFQDELTGNVRFLIHKMNARPSPVRVYLLAKNEGTKTATVTVDNIGIVDPGKFVLQSGKNSVVNYLAKLNQTQTNDSVKIEPGRTKIILPNLSHRTIATDHLLTMYVDVFSNQKVTYQIVVLDEYNDIMKTLPFLRGVNVSSDGVHIRGTFENSNRQIVVAQLIGTEQSRIIIGDGVKDPYLKGIDPLMNTSETNMGNFGVLYTLKLERVAPNTALLLNPRGGHYAGAFLVNGKLVVAPVNGYIDNPNETVVLYRTGDREEKVELQFLPASGSNLPLNFLTIPLKNVQ